MSARAALIAYVDVVKHRLAVLALRLGGAKALGFATACLHVKRRFRSRASPTVLVLTQPLFEKDIAEINREGRFNWFALSAAKFSRIQKLILPKEICRQRFFFESVKDAKYQSCWRRAEELGAGLLGALRLLQPIDAVLTAHIDYWQDEGLRRACARLGIPFLVLCHENYNIPKTYRVRRQEFTDLGFRFGGTAVATFSDHIRDMFVVGGVCSPDRVVVTGPPRYDGWKRVTNSPARRIVLLSFLNPQKYYASGDFFFAVLDALRRVVERSPGWELVVKCKNHRDEAAITSYLGQPPAICVGYDMPLPELLSSATVIVGSNSFSMVEGLLSGATMIVPAAGGHSGDPETMMFDPDDSLVARCVAFAVSPEALEQQVEASVRAGPPTVDRGARLALLQRYVCYSERETSARRVVDFMQSFIKPISTASVCSAERAGASS